MVDDPDLVSPSGLVPVMTLAERAGLPGLRADHVRPSGECGVNAQLRASCLVAGMAAGADSVDDRGLLRHGAMGEQLLAGLSDGPPAHLPSGTFTASAARPAIGAITHNLARAAGTPAGRRHAKARAATVRRDLIAVAARTARHGRGRLTLHCPTTGIANAHR